MSNSNDYLPFAIGSGANVESPATWLGDTVRQLGFQAGIAKSIQVNTAARQASVVAAMIAQFTADYGSSNVVDNGNIAALEAQFEGALTAFIAGAIGGAGSVICGPNARDGAVTPPSITGATPGMFFLSQATGDIWGPYNSTTQGGTAPIYWGNQRLQVVTGSTTLQAYNLLVNINGGATTGIVITMPDPTQQDGYTMFITNNGSVSVTLSTPAGNFVGSSTWPTPTNPITLGAGGRLILMCDTLNWQVFANTPA
jgi:hypothetical protein